MKVNIEGSMPLWVNRFTKQSLGHRRNKRRKGLRTKSRRKGGRTR